MKNNFQSTLKWGLIGGFAGIVFSLILFLMNVGDQNPLIYLSYLITVITVVFGMRDYKLNLPNKQAGFGDLFKKGIQIALVIGVISGIWSLIYVYIVDPGMIDRILLQTEIQLDERGMDEVQIKQTMEMTKKFMSPLFMFIIPLMGNAFWGLITSLITGLIMRTAESEMKIQKPLSEKD